MVYAYESFLVLIAISAIFIIGTVAINHTRKVKMPKKAKKQRS